MSSNSGFKDHEFADASEEAMCAIIYCRVIGLGSSITNLMLAKTKVAPLKTQTTPRLKLCAALLLCKLISFVSSSFDFSKVSLHFWSDSEVTLAWIASEPHLWKIFVPHRVAELQSVPPLFGIILKAKLILLILQLETNL